MLGQERSHLLPSPLASLCFLLYATRSASAKPSCAVMKLTLALGCRPPFHLRPPVFCHQSPSPAGQGWSSELIVGVSKFLKIRSETHVAGIAHRTGRRHSCGC